MPAQEQFTIGVEEEYQIVDRETRELRSRALRILPEAQAAVGDSVTPELYLSQIEIGTNVCGTLGEVRDELTRLRREIISAAESDGNRIAAAGTHPFSHWEDQELTPKRRYRGIAEEYEQLAREHLIYGCHIHVGVNDREAAIAVMNRARLWLAPLLALAANSPYSQQLYGAERWSQSRTPEQDLEPGEVAYNYDEWDRELTDTRINWCRVVEKRARHGERSFVELTRTRYRGVISSIKHQFQLMKPESLTRVRNELDGDDYDLDAVIGYVADRRAAYARGGGHPSERLYTKRLRRERDVAVSFLLDQSSSTARTIGRHPLQPYTHPGRRIIEIEKEGLVLMSEALEAVGDAYAIYGFTSEGRRNVKFYVVKDFDERYSEEIERRIGGINYQHNTRLGAAVRHAAARLVRQEARTRLLIVLSDGRPYDHDYGDARYAREDTREALRQARRQGIIPFCITIDRDSEAELKDLYGEVGYTIIDDVLSLPERMPAIYRRLTT